VIGWLHGRLRSKDAGQLIVDVGGVGWLVVAPTSTYLELPPVGEEVELFVSTQVREESISLYGFRERAEREIFERLQTVSGVGPRTALAALSALGPAELTSAIRQGDTRRLSTVPGIGKKTAERIVIDLHDRLEGVAIPAVAPAAGRAAGAAVGDVTSALVNLGYPERQAAHAIADALQEAGKGARPGFDDLLRAALQRLSRGAPT
jgi:Holliday junction DNA helicase RuvA